MFHSIKIICLFKSIDPDNTTNLFNTNDYLICTREYLHKYISKFREEYNKRANETQLI